MNNGVMMGGPVVSGTWQNPDNGDVVVVRDQYFDDAGGMFVTTTDGRQLDFNEFGRYLQISDTEMSDAEIAKIKGKRLAPDESILTQGLGPAPIANMGDMLPEDIAILQGKRPTPAVQPSNDNLLRGIEPDNQPKSTNYSIIAKAFKDKVPAPNVTLDWGEHFPEKQISLLTDIMEISVDEIAEYIYNEYINNKDVMVEKIKQCLN